MMLPPPSAVEGVASSPAPTMLDATLSVCVPVLNSSVAPAAKLNDPLLVPPSSLSVPLSTSTVPVLLKATPLLKVVVPVPTDFLKAPSC